MVEFDSDVPYLPIEDGAKVRAYRNSKDVRFKSPGRELHGHVYKSTPPHSERCFLGGKIRLGGAVRDGFHYDCVKARKVLYGGTFIDCHCQEVTIPHRSHLDVFPNDFIREA